MKHEQREYPQTRPKVSCRGPPDAEADLTSKDGTKVLVMGLPGASAREGLRNR